MVICFHVRPLGPYMLICSCVLSVASEQSSSDCVFNLLIVNVSLLGFPVLPLLLVIKH